LNYTRMFACIIKANRPVGFSFIRERDGASRTHVGPAFILPFHELNHA